MKNIKLITVLFTFGSITLSSCNSSGDPFKVKGFHAVSSHSFLESYVQYPWGKYKSNSLKHFPLDYYLGIDHLPSKKAYPEDEHGLANLSELPNYVKSFDIVLLDNCGTCLDSYHYTSDFLYNIDNLITHDTDKLCSENFKIEINFDLYQLVSEKYNGLLTLKESRITYNNETGQESSFEENYFFTFYRNKDETYLICEFNDFDFGYMAAYEELYGSTKWIIAY